MPANLIPETSERNTRSLPASSRRTRNSKVYAPARARRRRISEWIIEHAMMLFGLLAVLAVLLVLLFMLKGALPLFFTDHVRLGNFLFGADWRPISVPPTYEILALILGTLVVTLGAAVLAIPIGFAAAVYLAELAPRALREFIKPTVEMLAAIPSVVMGFIGLMVLNPWLKTLLHLDSGLMALTASVMLALMAMPTVISIAEDALSAVPRSFREGSLALGAGELATIRHNILPAARSGLIAAAMLGVGRAIGETMTVMMVAGGSIQVPLYFLGDNSLALIEKLRLLVTHGFGLLDPVYPMTTSLASEMGETAVGSPHYHALFAIGALLCLISFAITMISHYALHRRRR